MYSEEPVEFVIRNEIAPDPWVGRKWWWRRKIGEWLSYFVEPALRMHEINRVHAAQSSRAINNGARLSDVQFQELADYQETAMDLDLRRRDFRNSNHTRTLHGIAPPYVEAILKKDSTVRSVLDIGCNYAYMDWLMAQRFPHVQFHGVDAPRNLEEVNADLLATVSNLKIHSGYALDCLEKGSVKADLVYFSSTAATIRNAELKAYFRQLALTSKWLVLSEPIYPSPGMVGEEGHYENPDEIDADSSRPTYLQVHFASNKRGYVCYLHNYRAIAEACGFEVEHYRIFRPSFSSMHWITLVARNKDRSLWESGAGR